MKTIFFLGFCFWSLVAFAQDEPFDSQDRVRFKQKADTFARWLESSPYGELLQYEKISVTQKRLIGYLKTKPQGDSARIAWNQMKFQFEQQNPKQTLEGYLFYRWVTMTQCMPVRTRIEILEHFDKAQIKCFFVGIEVNQDTKKVVVDDRICQDAIDRSIKIPIPKLSKINQDALNINAGDLVSRQNEAVRRRIKRFLNDYFTQKKKIYPETTIRWTRDDPQELQVIVKAIRKELFPDEENTFVANFLTWLTGDPYTDIRREKLEITMTFDLTSDGLELKTSVLGKYASGAYDDVPQDRAFIDMTEGAAYTTYLEIYVKSLNIKIQEAITTP